MTRSIPILPAALGAMLAAAAAPNAAWAETPVVIDGVNKETREAILDLLPDRDAPESLFDAERIAEEAAARATAWLRSEGYYASEVIPEATETPPSARLVIRPGDRFRFSAPTLVYEGDQPTSETQALAARAIAPVAAEAPARAAAVLQAEADALAALANNGYAEAAAGRRSVVVDHATQRVDVGFTLAAGQRVRLGEIRTEPAGVFRSGFLRRLRNWSEGETYSPDRLAQLRRDLSSTGAVSRVNTRLEPANAEGVSNVVLDIEPAKRNAYELGIGYSTTEGVGVEGEWTRRNFSGRADSLTLSATAGELTQSLGIELLRPHASGLQRAQRFFATAQREDSVAFTQNSIAIGGAVESAPRMRFGLSYGASLAANQYENVGGGGVENAVILSSFGNLRRDTTDVPLDPRNGAIAEFRAEPSVSTGDATLGFIRTTAEGRIYESFGRRDQLTLAARARGGWIEAIAGSAEDVPPDRRFYAGGGGSVRGYEYNSIFPERRERLALAPGGQGLLEGSLEARWRSEGPYGAALFIDGGNAFDDWGNAADLRFGAGVGFRYDLGFAPLRIDLAFPLDRREDTPNYALYISLGQAF
ncbi:outer membrane protein assembly factor YaeT precursor [alpha proteobacterium U9-1i]|nr:outer membrane protein assembly factor YaeT precursor [alpha proteobacterium U9-1i]